MEEKVAEPVVERLGSSLRYSNGPDIHKFDLVRMNNHISGVVLGLFGEAHNTSYLNVAVLPDEDSNHVILESVPQQSIQASVTLVDRCEDEQDSLLKLYNLPFLPHSIIENKANKRQCLFYCLRLHDIRYEEEDGEEEDGEEEDGEEEDGEVVRDVKASLYYDRETLEVVPVNALKQYRMVRPATPAEFQLSASSSLHRVRHNTSLLHF